MPSSLFLHLHYELSQRSNRRRSAASADERPPAHLLVARAVASVSITIPASSPSRGRLSLLTPPRPRGRRRRGWTRRRPAPSRAGEGLHEVAVAKHRRREARRRCLAFLGWGCGGGVALRSAFAGSRETDVAPPWGLGARRLLPVPLTTGPLVPGRLLRFVRPVERSFSCGGGGDGPHNGDGDGVRAGGAATLLVLRDRQRIRCARCLASVSLALKFDERAGATRR